MEVQKTKLHAFSWENKDMRGNPTYTFRTIERIVGPSNQRHSVFLINCTLVFWNWDRKILTNLLRKRLVNSLERKKQLRKTFNQVQKIPKNLDKNKYLSFFLFHTRFAFFWIWTRFKIIRWWNAIEENKKKKIKNG